MISSRSRFVARLDAAVVRLEEAIFLLLTGSLVVLGAIPIGARCFGLPGASWAGPLSQHLLLWITLLGAGAASRDRKHITIDVIGQFLPPRSRRWLRALANLVAGAVCGALVPIALRFFLDEVSAGAGSFPVFFGIPAPWLTAPVPLGFLLLSIRLFCAGVGDLAGREEASTP